MGLLQLCEQRAIDWHLAIGEIPWNIGNGDRKCLKVGIIDCLTLRIVHHKAADCFISRVANVQTADSLKGVMLGNKFSSGTT